jgi:transcriptional regulator GlxA family with amidase domain
MKVAFAVFPGAEELDLVGPWEALALARDYGERELDLYTAAITREPVRLRGGLRVVPDHAFGSEPAADAIVVPGGPGTRDEAAWKPVVAWVAARRATPLLASVCTGSFVLARAGVLDGRAATTHYARLRELREQHPAVHVVDDRRVVDEGDVITAGGVTSGIDLGLHLVARWFGDELAARVAEVMEYPLPGDAAAAGYRSHGAGLVDGERDASFTPDGR